jgi:hypothetical protein
MSDLSPAIAEGLREWAKGSLPAIAAVEFLLNCPDVLYDGHPMLELVPGPSGHWRPDFEPLDRLSMSGGTVAAWRLARSLLEGELEDDFWRLDGTRKTAFVNALIRTM